MKTWYAISEGDKWLPIIIYQKLLKRNLPPTRHVKASTFNLLLLLGRDHIGCPGLTQVSVLKLCQFLPVTLAVAHKTWKVHFKCLHKMSNQLLFSPALHNLPPFIFLYNCHHLFSFFTVPLHQLPLPFDPQTADMSQMNYSQNFGTCTKVLGVHMYNTLNILVPITKHLDSFMLFF